MKTQLQRPKDLVQSVRHYRPTRKTYVFLVCIAVSTFIWFLIALSKDYTTFVEFPVQYINAPQGELVTNDLPDNITMEVSSHGFGLVSLLWFSNKTLDVDLSGLRFLGKEGAERRTYVVTSDLVDQFSSQFESSVALHQDRIFPDTIHVSMSDTVTKRVRVNLDLDLSFKPQFAQAGNISVNPPTVDVFGPRSILDTLTSLSTESVVLQDISEDQSFTVGIKTPASLLEYELDYPEILVSVPVDRYTETSVMVPVQSKNVPEGFKVTLHPDSIEVRCLVAMGDFSRVKQDLFDAVVELPDTSELSNRMRLRIQLRNNAEFVELIDFSPQRVEPFIRSLQ